jgi:hypothetical protein
MLFLSSSPLLDFVMAGDGLARRSGDLSSPMQPCRGRINVVNLQTRTTGAASKDLRALYQRIDIISLLDLPAAGYRRTAHCSVVAALDAVFGRVGVSRTND